MKYFFYIITIFLAVHISINISAWSQVKCGLETPGTGFVLLFVVAPFQFILLSFTSYWLYNRGKKKGFPEMKLFLNHLGGLVIMVLFLFIFGVITSLDRNDPFCPYNVPFLGYKNDWGPPKCDRGGCQLSKFIFNFNYLK